MRLQLEVLQYGRVTRVPVKATVVVTAPVVVAARPIVPLQTLSRADVEIRSRDITDFTAIPCFRVGEVTGKRANRVIAAGAVLTARMLDEPPAVRKGDPIFIESRGAGPGLRWPLSPARTGMRGRRSGSRMR